MKFLLAIALFFSITAQAHAFLVTDFDGNRVDVRDHVGDGRWTIVMLWQLECVLCEKHKPAVEAFHEKHSSSKAHVLGLVIDGHEYMPEIKKFMKKTPTKFPSLVVFGDVFDQQVLEETGKQFPTAPGYIVYTPNGEMKLALNNLLEIDELLNFLESHMGG